MIRKMFSLVVCALTLSVMVPAVAMADGSVVVFGKTGELLDSVSYSVSYSGPVNHTIFDLELGTGTYNVYQGGVLQGAVPVSSENAIVFDSDGGGAFLITQGEPGEDTTPPTGSVTMNTGAAFTTSSSVTLTLSASDAESGMGAGAEMRFSSDNLNWSSPEPYAASRAWSLSGNDDQKTVYAQFKDAAGNWMAGAVSDSIILDTTEPEASITFPQSGLTINLAAINISGTASDANGIASISVNGVPAESSDNFATWTATISLSEGSNNVNIEATDIPGNTYDSADSITVILDTIPPSQPSPPSILGG